jgi:predicted TIM-barrel fold metal-dependent hydrolase
MRVLDADVHCAVPSFAALDPYLSAYWRDELRVGGTRCGHGLNFTYPSWCPALATPAEELTLERIRADVLARADLAILHCYYPVEGATHPYLAAALSSAVNRWLAAEWLDREERLLASAVIAPQHTEEAIAEVERIAADPRFVQLLLPGRSIEAYGNKRFWPIWDAAAEAGLAVAINLGGVSGTPPTPVNWPDAFFEEYAAGPIQFQGHLASLLFSGVFDRHPDLKVVFVESGCSWLPATIWRLDREYKEARREVPWVKELPAEYVRRHVRLTTAPFDLPPDGAALEQVLDALGSTELLLYASDYPHRYGVEVLDALPAGQRAGILWDNAARCYGRRLPTST